MSAELMCGFWNLCFLKLACVKLLFNITRSINSITTYCSGVISYIAYVTCFGIFEPCPLPCWLYLCYHILIFCVCALYLLMFQSINEHMWLLGGQYYWMGWDVPVPRGVSRVPARATQALCHLSARHWSSHLWCQGLNKHHTTKSFISHNLSAEVAKIVFLTISYSFQI